MTNDGGVPGQGGQHPQDPDVPRDADPRGSGAEYPPGSPSQTPSGWASPDPRDQRGIPQYGQYAPPGYQYQAPVPTGPSAPWSQPSVGESHGFAWRAFGRSAGVWVAMVLLLGIVSLGSFVVFNPWYMESVSSALDAASAGDQTAAIRIQEQLAEQTASTSFILVNTLLGLVSQILGMTLYAAALASTRRRRVGFGDFFALRNWSGILLFAVVMTLVSFVTGLVPVLGSVLEIAVTLFTVAAPYFILDRELNAFEAIAQSVKLVSANFGIVILAGLIALGYTIAGACACGVGLLVVVPFATIFGAHLYRRLRGEPIEADRDPMSS